MILVVGPSWVGDAVMAQSLFMTLKRRFPACRIDVLAPAWVSSLFERMPEVDATVVMPVGHGRLGLMERVGLARQLRCRGYDQAVVLPNSWKSALVPFLAGIPKRTGYTGEARWGLINDRRPLDKRLLPTTVQRFVALASDGRPSRPPDFPPPRLAIGAEAQHVVCDHFSLAPGAGKVLGLCPGAEYGPSKRWPASGFAAVARQKLGEGWSVWLFGSAKDRIVADEIDRATDHRCRNFAGRTTLAQAVDLLSMTDCVVTNDSGLMHVAAALQRPLIAVYGASDPAFTPPLDRQARILSATLDCSPCFKRECRFGHYECLRRITPQNVLAELDRL